MAGRGTPLVVDLAGSTHAGKVRETNEDHYLIVRFGRSLETLGTNLNPELLQVDFETTGYGMVLADGIGGMAGGEVASRLALTRLVELVRDTPDWILAINKPRDAATVLQRMAKRFVEIDQTVRDEALRVGSLRGMGTTLTIAATLGSDLIFGHIGDSRVYLLREGNLTQLTQDHTLAQALISAGVLRAGDSEPRAIRHVLTAAVGSLKEATPPQVQRVKLQRDDCLLLCTDGLTDMVDDATITLVLRDAGSSQRACHDLVDLALANGGKDNVTVIVACFGE